MIKRRYSALVGLALAATAVLLPASSASAGSSGEVPNACANNVTANFSQIGVTTSGDDGLTSVAAGGSTTTTGLSQSGAVPGAIFVAGYNLGILHVGQNDIPALVNTKIEGTNTTQGTQQTNNASTAVTTTITDPDGTPGTGDETASDATFTANYDNLSWTAGASGTIDYRQDSIATWPATDANNTLRVQAAVGFLTVVFRCAPGTVTPPDPGTVALIDPAASFDTTQIQAPNQAPTANAGPDQTVQSGASVQLNGTGSSDPDGDALTYMWTQTSGPSVTLSDATSATPTFTAPTGPATLTFDLQVCDPEPLCSTDSVTITVLAPPMVDKAGEVIVNGPVKAGATSKVYVLRVTNLGSTTNTVDCATEIDAAVLVNGTENGTVSCLTASKTLGPGARARFRLRWNGDPLPAGATVEFTACVNESGDIDPSNNCGSVTRTT